MNKLAKRAKGFTLIELVIVLAIAALIILVVLQAVGAAQKSNRDSTRKQEAARVVSLLEQYASNKGGLYPSTASSLADGTQNVTGTTTTGALYAYDKNLDQKYNVLAGTFVAGGTMTGACPTVVTNTYTLLYAPATATNTRDYQLGVCLEAGGLSTIH